MIFAPIFSIVLLVFSTIIFKPYYITFSKKMEVKRRIFYKLNKIYTYLSHKE